MRRHLQNLLSDYRQRMDEAKQIPILGFSFSQLGGIASEAFSIRILLEVMRAIFNFINSRSVGSEQLLKFSDSNFWWN